MLRGKKGRGGGQKKKKPTSQRCGGRKGVRNSLKAILEVKVDQEKKRKEKRRTKNNRGTITPTHQKKNKGHGLIKVTGESQVYQGIEK